jgi:hypothetical protein
MAVLREGDEILKVTQVHGDRLRAFLIVAAYHIDAYNRFEISVAPR